MNNLALYTDTGKIINYKILLEGAEISNAFSRLCLEFDSGENVYFKGRIDNLGNCKVDITGLAKFEGKGRAKIEVVADSSYFPIHEMAFTLKKRVKIKLEGLDENETLMEETPLKVGFQFTEEDIIEDKTITTPKETSESKETTETKETPIVESESNPKDYITPFSEFRKQKASANTTKK